MATKTRRTPSRSSKSNGEQSHDKKGVKKRFGAIKCFNCGERGHMAIQCPSNALYCESWSGVTAHRSGTVEGMRVSDIVLDTGCSQTMVRRDLVAKSKGRQ